MKRKRGARGGWEQRLLQRRGLLWLGVHFGQALFTTLRIRSAGDGVGGGDRVGGVGTGGGTGWEGLGRGRVGFDWVGEGRVGITGSLGLGQGT